MQPNKMDYYSGNEQISVLRYTSAAEVTQHIASEISPETYFYKYSALGANFHNNKFNVTLYNSSNDIFLGFCGAAPVRVLFESIETIAFWTCDLYIIEKFRGKGLGNYLYEVIEKDQPLLIGFGTSDMAFPLKIKRGWSQNKNVYEYFYRNKSYSLLQNLRKLTCHVKRKYNNAEVDNRFSYPLTSQVNFNKLDELWNEIKSNYCAIVIRDAQYIKWRYIDSPAGNLYKFIIAVDDISDKYKAVLIIRETLNTIKIVDYIGPAKNETVKARLLIEVLNSFPDKELFQIISSCNYWHTILAKVGFYRFKLQPRFTLLANGFKTNMVADDWFIMLGDSDGEHIEAMKMRYKDK